MAAFEAEISALLGMAIEITERVDFFSKAFLERPYLIGANGEGEEAEFDQRPLFRTDFFDCLTYVNTVFALAISENLEDFRRNIVKVNYREARSVYENRHHFMSIDWNPENKKLGLIEEISDTLGIPLELAETTIDRMGFFQHRQFQDIKRLLPLSSDEEDRLLKKMRELGKNFGKQPSCLAYLSLENLLNNHAMQKIFFEKLPSVSLVEMVRPNWDLRDKIGTHLNVSHVGFLFKREKNLLFRHATATLGKVVEVDFWDYVEAFKLSPTLKGIAVFRQNRFRPESLGVERP